MVFMLAFALIIVALTLTVQRLAYALSEALLIEMREVRIVFAWLNYRHFAKRIERTKRRGTLRSPFEWLITWCRPRPPGPELVPARLPPQRPDHRDEP
jgi:hypothetical protein